MEKTMKDEKEKEAKEEKENYDTYWELVNLIDTICKGFIFEKDLFMDDVTSALDRVKGYIIQEQIKMQMYDELGIEPDCDCCEDCAEKQLKENFDKKFLNKGNTTCH